MAKVCPDCVYYNPNDHTCRIRPPSVLLAGNTPTTLWPTVASTDWCAEGYNATDGNYDTVSKGEFTIMPQKNPGRKV